MRKSVGLIYSFAFLIVLSNFVNLPIAKADTSSPEILSVTPSTTDIYVGKKWNNVTFQVVVKDRSVNVKTSKSILKSTNTQSKNIDCDDTITAEKSVSGEFFEHHLYINCILPKNTSAPDIRYLEFTVSNSVGLSSIYSSDTNSPRVNFIFGFDPKVVEKSLTDAGKIRLVDDCTSYEQQRIGALDLYKEVAKFPAGNPFEVRYKEGKTALASAFNCSLGADLLTRVSDYEDLIRRLSIGFGEFLSYQQKLKFEQINALKATSITCIKGKVTKTVKGVNPKCPTGYKKK